MHGWRRGSSSSGINNIDELLALALAVVAGDIHHHRHQQRL
jgi:hypothetical protein